MRRVRRDAGAPLFAGRRADITEENIQARMRGVLLMALSNKFGAHAAHHRQQVGDVGRLRHALRRHVRRLLGPEGHLQDRRLRARALAQRARAGRRARPGGPRDPGALITKPPTAELRPNQTDQDSLPPYDVLDAILHGLVEEEALVDRDRRQGLRRATRRARVSACSYPAEYKRRQAPPGREDHAQEPSAATAATRSPTPSASCASPRPPPPAPIRLPPQNDLP